MTRPILPVPPCAPTRVILGLCFILMAASGSGFEADNPTEAREGVAIPTATYTGDLDDMVKRRTIRVLTVYSKTTYFFEEGTQRGLTYDTMTEFADQLNEKLRTRNRRVNVEFIPVERDEVFRALLEGRGDIGAAFLTITPERERVVDFSDPVLRDIREIAVTAPGTAPLTSTDDLAGKVIFVRKSSSYYSSLLALNEALKKIGKPAVVLKAAPEDLEDEDLLEMLNARLLRTLIVDRHIAELWKRVFPEINLYPNVALRTGATIGWAVRKNNPRLKAELNAFNKKFGVKTTFGALTFDKYLRSTKFLTNAADEEELRKFRALIDIFRKYGDQYSLDWMLMAAQGYQESHLDQNARSAVGAIGVMQVMPATGKEMDVGDINLVDPNIHAGLKYIRFLIDQYYKDDPMDNLNKHLFAFAAYNAGPTRIDFLRAEAARRGMNRDVWFNSVERVAAEKIGGETVTYVRNIYKYYIAYQLVQEEARERVLERREVKEELGNGVAH